ncbi:MAG: S-adenosylmethionine:tRNA ribosyltransferase-isomerase, partial [Candidatus Binatia bacterium]
MELKEFLYELPRSLIVADPAEQRSDSRLMVVDRRAGRISHRSFSDLDSVLHRGDMIVLNDTRVLPARLFGRKDSGGRVEILLERVLDTRAALVQIRASKPPRPGTRMVRVVLQHHPVEGGRLP